MKETNDNFIMLPTVDFCFKELMMNPKVRTGFIAALLDLLPSEVQETKVLPTELPRGSEDEKLGILDVFVKMMDGTQMNLEMQVHFFAFWDSRILFYLSKMFSGQLHRGESYDRLRKCIHVSILDFNRFDDGECYHIVRFYDGKTKELYSDLLELQFLELKKLPPEAQSEKGIIRWMRFLHGKTRKEFEKMAGTDEYMEEAYQTLIHLSADEKKRLEYEVREKALRDYNSQMKSAKQEGIALGRAETFDITIKIIQLNLQGKSPQEIANLCNLRVEEVVKYLEALSSLPKSET